ncbi:MAG TPA: cytochrome c [Acidimicrobiales bacterium]|jgi:cytochrome c oxidase subunit 2
MASVPPVRPVRPVRFLARERRALVAVLALALVLAGGLAACGGDSGSGNVTLSAAGARGKALAGSNGCSGCHTTSGSRGTGPTWKGLAGSQVKLSGGKTVTATDAYLRRSIEDPGAQVVSSFAGGIMPSNHLSPSEIADVIAYIHDLSAPPATTTTAAS